MTKMSSKIFRPQGSTALFYILYSSISRKSGLLIWLPSLVTGCPGLYYSNNQLQFLWHKFLCDLLERQESSKHFSLFLVSLKAGNSWSTRVVTHIKITWWRTVTSGCPLPPHLQTPWLLLATWKLLQRSLFLSLCQDACGTLWSSKFTNSIISRAKCWCLSLLRFFLLILSFAYLFCLCLSFFFSCSVLLISSCAIPTVSIWTPLTALRHIIPIISSFLTLLSTYESHTVWNLLGELSH